MRIIFTQFVKYINLFTNILTAVTTNIIIKHLASPQLANNSPPTGYSPPMDLQDDFAVGSVQRVSLISGYHFEVIRGSVSNNWGLLSKARSRNSWLKFCNIHSNQYLLYHSWLTLPWFPVHFNFAVKVIQIFKHSKSKQAADLCVHKTPQC